MNNPTDNQWQSYLGGNQSAGQSLGQSSYHQGGYQGGHEVARQTYDQGGHQHYGYQQGYQGGQVATLSSTGIAHGGGIRRREPFLVAILSFVTFGIYGLIWYYLIHREMAEQTRHPNAAVAGPVLVLIFLSWTGIAALISFYRTAERIADAQRHAGAVPTCNAFLALVIGLIPCGYFVYCQSELNKIARL